MGTPYLAEIRIVSFNFPPKGWAFCNGQLLPINQNQALFSLLGTTYGGNGTTNFALPNLNGVTMIGAGQGPGLSLETLGAQVGASNVTLSLRGQRQAFYAVLHLGVIRSPLDGQIEFRDQPIRRVAAER